jgi:hypothetical protein
MEYIWQSFSDMVEIHQGILGEIPQICKGLFE